MRFKSEASNCNSEKKINAKFTNLCAVNSVVEFKENFIPNTHF